MLTVVNPATGEVVREVEEDAAGVVEAKLAAAAEAFPKWRDTRIGERAEMLRRVAKSLRAGAEAHAALMTEEMGKPVREGRGEVEKSAWCAEHYAEHAEGYLARVVLPSDATESFVAHRPLGPVLGILPWNAPFWLAFRFAAPALMAGNVCLMKHDPHVAGCAAALVAAVRDAGLPAGVFDALYLATDAVEPVIRDRRVRAVSFTGSTRGGRAVAAIAASEVKPAVLELGGSDPCLVLRDADLELAAEAAKTMRIINAGQSCIAAKRILVEAPVYEEFLERLEGKLAALSVGDPSDPQIDVGPIARADLRDELDRQVRETVEQGAECRLGGERPDGPGFFYPVTLLAGVEPGMTAFTEETFGPVAAVGRVADLEEAIAVANDTEYGLAASVFTAAPRGKEIAARLEAGQVAVNGVVKTDPRLPSGGVKASGYGRELGPHGIREFVNAQQVWVGPAVPPVAAPAKR